MHTELAGRQNIKIISIILTFSQIMYSFYDKILFLESSSPYCLPFSESCAWKILKSAWLLFFTVKSLIDTECVFIGNCKFFHQFSTKYSLSNNIANFQKILCVESSCRRHPKEKPQKGGGGRGKVYISRKLSSRPIQKLIFQDYGCGATFIQILGTKDYYFTTHAMKRVLT